MKKAHAVEGAMWSRNYRHRKWARKLSMEMYFYWMRWSRDYEGNLSSFAQLHFLTLQRLVENYGYKLRRIRKPV